MKQKTSLIVAISLIALAVPAAMMLRSKHSTIKKEFPALPEVTKPAAQ